jgi:FMN-dependent NADH-azoreductase
MARLLYVEASPRKDRSASIEAARIFLTEYQKTHPKDAVETLDLWHTPLPEFDGEVIKSKYAILHGLKHTEAQRHAWSAVEKIISHFTSADKYVFSLPMWNFGVPYPYNDASLSSGSAVSRAFL